MSHIRPIVGLACALVVAGCGVSVAAGIEVLSASEPEVHQTYTTETGSLKTYEDVEALPPVLPCEQKINVGADEILWHHLVPYLECTWRYLPAGHGTFEEELNRLLNTVQQAAPYANLDDLHPATTIQFIGPPGNESVYTKNSGLEGTDQK